MARGAGRNEKAAPGKAPARPGPFGVVPSRTPECIKCAVDGKRPRWSLGAALSWRLLSSQLQNRENLPKWVGLSPTIEPRGQVGTKSPAVRGFGGLVGSWCKLDKAALYGRSLGLGDVQAFQCAILNCARDLIGERTDRLHTTREPFVQHFDGVQVIKLVEAYPAFAF